MNEMPQWNNGEGDAAKSAGRILPVGAVPTLSFIESHEEKTAVDLIDQQFLEMCGKKYSTSAHACGYMAVVKIYIRPEDIKEITDVNGNKVKLVLPDSMTAEDKFQSCCGLVVDIGPGAFRNKDGSPRYHGPLPYKVGDWLLFPRSDIIRVDFRGVALGLMTDDKGLVVIEDPADWQAGYLTTRL